MECDAADGASQDALHGGLVSQREQHLRTILYNYYVVSGVTHNIYYHTLLHETVQRLVALYIIVYSAIK